MVKKASQTPSEPTGAWGSLTTPYSQEAEEAVIGAVVVDNSRFESCAKLIAPDAFFIMRHRYVWQALSTLQERKTPIDYLTLCQQLKDDGKLAEIGGAAYITQLVNSTPTSSHAIVYASMVERYAKRRQMLMAADEYRRLALDESITIEDAIKQGAEQVESVKPPIIARAFSSMHDIMSAMYDEFEERISSGVSTMGINTGYQRLNEILGGWRDNRLHIVGGRPGMGKTAFMLDSGVQVARQVKPITGEPYNVLFVSMEMKKEELAERLLANNASLTTHQILSAKLTPAQQGSMTKAFGDLHTLPLHISDEGDVTTKRLKEMCLDFKADHGTLDMLIVDYLGLMKAEGTTNRSRTRENEVASMSRDIKTLANLMSIPILLGSQLNRDVEKRKNKRPLMSDLRESGATEQDADVIIFPYFPNYYIDPEMKEGRWEIIVVKQRNGGLGTMQAWANFKTMNFREQQINV